MDTDISLVGLDPSTKPLLGSIAWRVSYGLANLSIEFGKPSIDVVHEPMPSKRVTCKGEEVSIANVRRRLNRRRIVVRGRWNLWVYHAHWRIIRSGVRLASRSSSMKIIGPALLDVQGQRIVNVLVNTSSGATRFEFDLDTVLEVRRERRDSRDEIWLLYGRDGYVRSIRGDGNFGREVCEAGCRGKKGDRRAL